MMVVMDTQRHEFKENGGKYEIQRLTERHKEMARLVAGGVETGELALFFNMSKNQVSNIRGSSVFQDYLNTIVVGREKNSIDIANRLNELLPFAVNRVKEIISEPVYFEDEDEDGNRSIKVNQSVSPELKFKVASNVLDRAGFGAVNKILVGHVNEERMKELKQEALAAGIEDGIIVTEEEDDDRPIGVDGDETEA